MRNITIQGKVLENGQLVVDTTNKNIATVLNNLIENGEDLKYVKLSKYTKKFGTPSFVFEFCCADTIEEAIKLESVEVSIKREIEELLNTENANELKTYLKKSFDKKYHKLISEEIFKANKKIQSTKMPKIDLLKEIELYELNLAA